jgi:hypothetical protein
VNDRELLNERKCGECGQVTMTRDWQEVNFCANCGVEAGSVEAELLPEHREQRREREQVEVREEVPAGHDADHRAGIVGRRTHRPISDDRGVKPADRPRSVGVGTESRTRTVSLVEIVLDLITTSSQLLPSTGLALDPEGVTVPIQSCPEQTDPIDGASATEASRRVSGSC